MTVSDCYELASILREMEKILSITASDYEERDVDVLLKNVRERLERQYQIGLIDGKIDATANDILAYQSVASIFIDNVARIHARLSGYCQIARYKKTLEVSMTNVNFVGFTETSMRTVLMALAVESTQASAESAVTALKQKLSTISVCVEKRLLLAMVVAYEIGIYELASTCAEVLYLACI